AFQDWTKYIGQLHSSSALITQRLKDGFKRSRLLRLFALLLQNMQADGNLRKSGMYSVCPAVSTNEGPQG
ncbi:hypothetical protein OFN30_33660, partial [Escherichia coli]|nr:hypothetical protein [Escherichia coli]